MGKRSDPKRNSDPKADGPIRRQRPVRAILFDFDGTLTLPGHLDFAQIRAAIGCPGSLSLLDYIDSLVDPEERRHATAILDRFEAEAANRAREDPEAGTVVRYCRGRGLKLGIITRNSEPSIERSFSRFRDIRKEDFDVVVTRDDPVEVKPAPDGVLLACSRLGVDPQESILVGDFLYDIDAGKQAGAVTVFYDSDPERDFDRPSSDHAIQQLGELREIVALYLPLPAGKVPNDLLARFLADDSPNGSIPATASAELASENADALLVGPGVGEDVAAISIDRIALGEPRGASQLLLVKSDPITFIAEGFGHYLLTVNANDIATAGGVPRWLLATMLVPPGTLPVEIGRHFSDLKEGCARAGVSLCGGHTELTDAVTRPVVSGTMIGTVDQRRLLRKDAIASGDCVLLTKGIAIEGSAIIAERLAGVLRNRGVAEETIARGAALSREMSVLPEAQIAARIKGVKAMHDVTEGGIATALRELSSASGHRLRVELDKIEILPETRAFCQALGINPLGLIGSGSLLVCARTSAALSLHRQLSEAGIRSAVIAEVVEAGEGVAASLDGRPAELPSFDTDELTRIV